MNEPTTIRDALEATVPQEDDASVVEAAPEPVADATESVSTPTETKSERVRATDGKFSKSGDKPAEEPSISEAMQSESTPAITPGPKSEPAKEKAPVSWRPEVREHWSTLPADVRAEVRQHVKQAVAVEHGQLMPA